MLLKIIIFFLTLFSFFLSFSFYPLSITAIKASSNRLPVKQDVLTSSDLDQFVPLITTNSTLWQSLVLTSTNNLNLHDLLYSLGEYNRVTSQTQVIGLKLIDFHARNLDNVLRNISSAFDKNLSTIVRSFDDVVRLLAKINDKI